VSLNRASQAVTYRGQAGFVRGAAPRHADRAL